MAHGKKVFFTGVFNWLIRIGMCFSGFLKKIFGTLVYNANMSITLDVVSLEQSILNSERKIEGSSLLQGGQQ